LSLREVFDQKDKVPELACHVPELGVRTPSSFVDDEPGGVFGLRHDLIDPAREIETGVVLDLEDGGEVRDDIPAALRAAASVA
jgi:hypothetical protein